MKKLFRRKLINFGKYFIISENKAPVNSRSFLPIKPNRPAKPGDPTRIYLLRPATFDHEPHPFELLFFLPLSSFHSSTPG